jgi:hypothetical protein
MSLTQNSLQRLELDLKCYANRITPEMSAYELRQALQGVIPGSESLTISLSENGNQLINLGDKTLEVGPMASNDEIILALQNPWIRTENTKIMSISGYEPGAIRAKLEALKKNGKERRDAALARLDDAGAKHEAVSAEIEKVATQIEKEADAAIAEFASFTNGGPSL